MFTYCLSLVPVSAADRERLVAAAQVLAGGEGGSNVSEGRRLPHIPLCQFRALVDEDAVSAAEGLCGASADVTLENVFFMQGAGRYRGHQWVGVLVRLDERLRSLQTEAVEHLDLRVHTMASIPLKAPHLLLGRTTRGDSAALWPSLPQTLDCVVSVGVQDEEGYMTEVVC